jgi:hypothetical protein
MGSTFELKRNLLFTTPVELCKMLEETFAERSEPKVNEVKPAVLIFNKPPR